MARCCIAAWLARAFMRRMRKAALALLGTDSIRWQTEGMHRMKLANEHCKSERVRDAVHAKTGAKSNARAITRCSQALR